MDYWMEREREREGESIKSDHELGICCNDSTHCRSLQTRLQKREISVHKQINIREVGVVTDGQSHYHSYAMGEAEIPSMYVVIHSTHTRDACLNMHGHHRIPGIPDIAACLISAASAGGSCHGARVNVPHRYLGCRQCSHSNEESAKVKANICTLLFNSNLVPFTTFH